VHQVGSHIILETSEPSHLPSHSPLRVGTISSILKAVATHKRVSREALLGAL